jgi:hypothetical protein
MTRLATASLCLLLCLIVTIPALASTLDFEDLYVPGGGSFFTILPSTYAGFNWSPDAGYVHDFNQDAYPSIVQGHVAFFNYFARDVTVSRDTPFSFDSAWMGASRAAQVTYTFEGWRGATQLYSAQKTISQTPGTIDLGFRGIDRLVIINSSGAGPSELCMDNMTFDSVIPEPSSLALMGIGLAALIARRRRTQA